MICLVNFFDRGKKAKSSPHLWNNNILSNYKPTFLNLPQVHHEVQSFEPRRSCTEQLSYSKFIPNHPKSPIFVFSLQAKLILQREIADDTGPSSSLLMVEKYTHSIDIGFLAKSWPLSKMKNCVYAVKP